MNALVIETHAGETTATRQKIIVHHTGEKTATKQNLETAADINQATGSQVQLVTIHLSSVTVYCAPDPFGLGLEANETAARLWDWLTLDAIQRTPLHSPLMILGAPDWEPDTGPTPTDCPGWLFDRFGL